MTLPKNTSSPTYSAEEGMVLSWLSAGPLSGRALLSRLISCGCEASGAAKAVRKLLDQGSIGLDAEMNITLIQEDIINGLRPPLKHPNTLI